MKKTFTFLVLLLTFTLNYDTYSLPGYVDAIPNGQKNKCMNCHFSMNGGSRNVFGVSFKNNNYEWNEILAKLDSDNDKFTNGQELQDPEGAWSIDLGSNTFGNPNLVTLPGNSSDFPSSVENENLISKFQVFPSPVIESINIKIESFNGETIEIKLYDFNGSLVNKHILLLNNNINDLSINREDNQGNRLPSGIYFIEVSNNFINQKQKIILE